MIVGIDEVGRGPWAGPLVFGAVILGDTDIPGLTDSKKLTKKRREVLSTEIHDKALAIGLGWVSAEELDKVGLSNALTLACRRALEQITVPYQKIIIDGTINFLKDTGKGPYVTTLAKADLLIPSVSAASIVAKVARDAFMLEQDQIYKNYRFGSHAGYGTQAHRAALEKYGVTPLHRKSFAPIAALLGEVSSDVFQPEKLGNPSQVAGRVAEDRAAGYLRELGYHIVARNWKTKICEIDIIATKANIVSFVEVKYRRSTTQGGGLAAITPVKLRHMERAARVWLQKHPAADAKLSVIELTGPRYEITQFIEQV